MNALLVVRTVYFYFQTVPAFPDHAVIHPVPGRGHGITTASFVDDIIYGCIRVSSRQAYVPREEVRRPILHARQSSTMNLNL